MNKHYDTLIEAINTKVIVNLTFNTKEKGLIIRQCIPFDFGPSRRFKDGIDRFHFYDIDSPDDNHTLSIVPEQINSLTLTNNSFDPKHYVTWRPNWIIARDWGSYS